MARISTHILDVSRGAPAAGVGVELYRVTGGTRQLVSSGVTNADGRTAEPLLPSRFCPTASSNSSFTRARTSTLSACR